MNRFELLRYGAGLTRAELADAAGIPVRTIRSLEDGSTQKPSAPVAKKLADFYELTVADLLGLATEEAA